MATLSGALLSKWGKLAVIYVRTDFRTDRESEIGISGMMELVVQVLFYTKVFAFLAFAHDRFTYHGFGCISWFDSDELALSV